MSQKFTLSPEDLDVTSFETDAAVAGTDTVRALQPQYPTPDTRCFWCPPDMTIAQ
jgi:hypothetical protein